MRASEIVKIIEETIEFSKRGIATYRDRIGCLESLLGLIKENNKNKKEKSKDAIL